jgi:hypothetical protein
MTRIQKIKSQCFSALAFIFFNRSKSLLFCSIYVLLSLLFEIKFAWGGFFSCSGAIVTIAGLFLNIKYSLNFHLKLSKVSLYNKLAGAGVYGTSDITLDQEKWVGNIISDEMFGVSFMVIGTLIWAYGSYLIKLVA